MTDTPHDPTILPSANTPEPDYEPGDLRPSPAPIPPRPEGSRVNPHGIKRSTGEFSAPSGEYSSGGWTPARPARSPGANPGQPGAQRTQGQRLPATGNPAGHPAPQQYAQGTGPRTGGAPYWSSPSAPSGPTAASGPSATSGPSFGGPNPNYAQHQQAFPGRVSHRANRDRESPIGAIGGLFALLGTCLALIAPFTTLINQPDAISLWGATYGSENSYIVFAGAAVGIVGAVLLLLSLKSKRKATIGGFAGIVAGFVIGAITAYLVTNSDHRDVIAQGGTFGPGVWLLIFAACCLLIGGILGLARGTVTSEGTQ